MSFAQCVGKRGPQRVVGFLQVVMVAGKHGHQALEACQSLGGRSDAGFRNTHAVEQVAGDDEQVALLLVGQVGHPRNHGHSFGHQLLLQCLGISSREFQTNVNIGGVEHTHGQVLCR